MKVVHISNYDNLGGASRAALKIHRGLSSVGVKSAMLVATKTLPDPTICELAKGLRFVHSAKFRMDRVLRHIGLADLWFSTYNNILSHPDIADADILHLHKIHGGFFSLSWLPSILQKIPIVWTLHDTWSLTGLCYYPLECQKWKTGCGNCPQVSRPNSIPIHLESRPIIDSTRIAYRVKKSIYQQCNKGNFVIVTPSQWLQNMVLTSNMFPMISVQHIPYGIDTATFNPTRRDLSRRRFGFTDNDKIIFFITGKGDKCFQEAIHKYLLSDHSLGTSKVKILLAGSKSRSIVLPPEIPTLRLGLIDNDQDMADCFAAADVFVLPTYSDNFPNVLIESQTSGTPVVAYAVCGVPEMVLHGRTGYLAAPHDSSDLLAGILTVLRHKDVTAMRQSTRYHAERAFSQSDQINKYIRIYQHLLN